MSEATSPEAEMRAIEALKEVRPVMSGAMFRAFWPILPTVPLELAVMRQINGVWCVLMFYRKDQDYTGWHMSGGYVWQSEQSDEETAKRILKREVGLVPKNLYFVRNFNTGPETGWVPNRQMTRLYVCEADGEPTVGKFFPLDQLPVETIGSHIMMIDHLKAHLLRTETMRREGITLDGQRKAPKGRWLVKRFPAAGDERREHQMGVHVPLEETLGTFAEAIEFMQKLDLARLFDDEGRQII